MHQDSVISWLKLPLVERTICCLKVQMTSVLCWKRFRIVMFSCHSLLSRLCVQQEYSRMIFMKKVNNCWLEVFYNNYFILHLQSKLSVKRQLKGEVCLQAKWPIRAALNSCFCSMKQLRILFLSLDGMLGRCKVTYQHYYCQYPFIHLGHERQSVN